jgi:hypothetical protein
MLPSLEEKKCFERGHYRNQDKVELVYCLSNVWMSTREAVPVSWSIGEGLDSDADLEESAKHKDAQVHVGDELEDLWKLKALPVARPAGSTRLE